MSQKHDGTRLLQTRFNIIPPVDSLHDRCCRVTCCTIDKVNGVLYVAVSSRDRTVSELDQLPKIIIKIQLTNDNSHVTCNKLHLTYNSRDLFHFNRASTISGMLFMYHQGTLYAISGSKCFLASKTTSISHKSNIYHWKSWHGAQKRWNNVQAKYTFQNKKAWDLQIILHYKCKYIALTSNQDYDYYLIVMFHAQPVSGGTISHFRAPNRQYYLWILNLTTYEDYTATFSPITFDHVSNNHVCRDFTVMNEKILVIFSTWEQYQGYLIIDLQKAIESMIAGSTSILCTTHIDGMASLRGGTHIVASDNILVILRSGTIGLKSAIFEGYNPTLETSTV